MPIQNHHVPFSRTRAISLFLASLVFCVSVTIVGLVARSLHWIFGKNGYVTLTFILNMYSDWRNRDFQSSEWTNQFTPFDNVAVRLDDTYALLVAGVLGGLFSLTVIALTLRGRPYMYNFVLSGRRAREFDLAGPSAIFYLDSCLNLVAVVAVAIAWAKWSQSADTLDWNLFPPHHVSYPLFPSSIYEPNRPPVFTLESWNCMLYGNMQRSPPAQTPSIGDMKALCYEGTASRVMLLPLLGLALLRIALKPISHFLAWRQYNIEQREKKLLDDATPGNNSWDIESMPLQAGKALRSSNGSSSYIHGRGPEPRIDRKEAEAVMTPCAVELAGDRTSKLELDDGAAVHEMYGEEGRSEVEGGVKIFEVDGQGKGWQS